MAYDIASYQSLGLLWKLLDVGSAERPDRADVTAVRAALEAARRDIVDDPTRDLRSRLGGASNRSASVRVRERLAALWGAEGQR
jgi:malonate decarboxylase gamma subunit